MIERWSQMMIERRVKTMQRAKLRPREFRAERQMNKSHVTENWGLTSGIAEGWSANGGRWKKSSNTKEMVQKSGKDIDDIGVEVLMADLQNLSFLQLPLFHCLSVVLLPFQKKKVNKRFFVMFFFKQLVF